MQKKESTSDDAYDPLAECSSWTFDHKSSEMLSKHSDMHGTGSCYGPISKLELIKNYFRNTF